MHQENKQNLAKVCINCGSSMVNSYCADCGQEAINSRYSVRKLFLEWINAFYNYSGGIYYTIKQLTVEPGTVIIDYISGKTRPYWNPFNFFVITFSVNILIGIKLGIVSSETKYETFTNDYAAYIVIITVPVVSFFSFLFFKKSGYNYAENLVLNLFITAQQNIYYTALFLLYIFFSNNNAGFITLIIGILYEFWVYKSFFRNSFAATAVKVLCINFIKVLVYIFILAISYFIAK